MAGDSWIAFNRRNETSAHSCYGGAWRGEHHGNIWAASERGKAPMSPSVGARWLPMPASARVNCPLRRPHLVAPDVAPTADRASRVSVNAR